MVARHLVAAQKQTFASLTGVVVSAGKMDRTVKVRVGAQKWNKQVQKHFTKPNNFLVHDPNNSIRTGDIVSITGGWKTSRSKRHVVQSIIRPAGVPIEERPPLPSQEELWANAIEDHAQKRLRKEAARAEKRAADGEPEGRGRRGKKETEEERLEREESNSLVEKLKEASLRPLEEKLDAAVRGQ